MNLTPSIQVFSALNILGSGEVRPAPDQNLAAQALETAGIFSADAAFFLDSPKTPLELKKLYAEYLGAVQEGQEAAAKGLVPRMGAEVRRMSEGDWRSLVNSARRFDTHTNRFLAAVANAGVAHRIQPFTFEQELGAMGLGKPDLRTVATFVLASSASALESVLSSFPISRQRGAKGLTRLREAWPVYRDFLRFWVEREAWRSGDTGYFARVKNEHDDLLDDRYVQNLYSIARSLAGEQILKISRSDGVLVPVRIRILQPDETDLPVRDGTVAIPLARIDQALDYYERVLQPLKPAERDLLRRAVVFLEAARRGGVRFGKNKPPMSRSYVYSVLTHWPFKLRQRALFLTRMAELWDRGEIEEKEWTETLQPLSVKALMTRIGRFFDLQRHEMSALLGRSRSRGYIRSESSKRLADLDAVRKLLQLVPFSERGRQTILYRVYQEELEWSFAWIQKPTPERELVFVTSGSIAPRQIRSERFHGILRKEMRKRPEWDAAERLRRFQAAGEGQFPLGRLRLLQEGAILPDLPDLQRTEVVLNTDRKPQERIAREALFLGAYPEFMEMLIIHLGRLGNPLPIEAEIAPEAPMPPNGRRRRLGIEKGVKALNPQGLAAYLRELRLAAGLEKKEAARRAGICPSALNRLEMDPGSKGACQFPRSFILASVATLYGADRQELLKRFLFSFFQDDPVLSAIRQRSSLGLLFYVNERAYRRFQKFLIQPRETAAEMLYILRAGETEAVRRSLVPFLATGQQTAAFLQIPPSTYERMEWGETTPDDYTAERILSRYGLPELAAEAFRRAVWRARGGSGS